ncbi:hypothetical protein ACIQU6_22810 [Streptomyces sp. NPDC090442]|uniref:hypothetical protein n=1 Tax=Streptomyces sp. NPDC090442 TaxID=3365962 RepID=UPI003808E930
MPGTRQRNPNPKPTAKAKPVWSMMLAAWILPVGLDGRQRESWARWSNWRIFLLLLLGPVLLLGAFTARGPGVTWWERGALAAAGAVITLVLVRVVIGYRQLKATARTTVSAPPEADSPPVAPAINAK